MTTMITLDFKTLLSAALAGVLAVTCGAGEGGKCAAAGPLAGLPSAPGPHVGKIKALGDDSWLDLGKPAPDPKWGPGEGRAYTNKMAYAADLVGAFLCGEGPHGAAHNRGGGTYYADDVFFYDLMAHRWICVSPGSNMAGFKMKLDGNGFEATEDGQNVPIAFAVHGYECNEYLPGLGRFMTLETGSPYSKKVIAIRKAWLAGHPFGRSLGKHPFLYDVKAGRWERRKVEGEGPRTHFCKSLTWVESLKRVMYYGRGSDFWLYDPEAGKWSHLEGKGEPPQGSRMNYEGTLCYDTKRDRLYVFNCTQKEIPWIYDIRTNTWSNPHAKNQPCPGNDYAKGVRMLSSTSSGVHYDTAGDVAVMRLTVKQGQGDPRNIPSKHPGLAVYDPEKNAWEEVKTGGSGGASSFYSPELNVHVYLDCRDGRTDGTIRVYRYKRAAGTAAGAGK
jgi:hypothetical protein